MRRQLLFRSSIRRRLLAAIVLGILLPLVLLNAAFIRSFYRDMYDRTLQAYVVTNRQITVDIDNMLAGVEEYTLFPYFNDEFQRYLTTDYAADDATLTRDKRLYHLEVINSVLRYNSHISRAIMYHAQANQLFMDWTAYGSTADVFERVLPLLGDMASRDGKELVVRFLPAGLGPDKTPAVILARSMFDVSTYRYQGCFILMVPVNELARMFQPADYLDGVQQFVVDGAGQILYSNDESQIGTDAPAEILRFLSREQDCGEYTVNGTQVTLIRSRCGTTDWNVVSVMDTSVLFRDATARVGQMALELLGWSAIALAVAGLVAYSITHPIQGLQQTITRIIGGNREARVTVATCDEVGKLAEHFNKMLDELQRVQDEVVVREQEKKSAELMALQMQINPHFLYNTLNTIKWMANMQCAGSIAQACDALVYLLRCASSGKEVFTVREEYAFTQKYLDLLALRYFDSFDVTYSFDEAALDCSILRFLLQPFIENAVFHGFKGAAGQNELFIGCQRQGERIIFHIRDNGAGMEPEEVRRLLTEPVRKKSGFNSIGVYNVVQRIALNYGPEYGVSIHSVPGQGTDVEVVIPAIDPEEGGDAHAADPDRG